MNSALTVTAASSPTGIDVAAERARTPGAALFHHFNAAGCSLPTTDTVAAVVEHLHREANLGGYEAAAEMAAAAAAVYTSIGQVVGVAPEKVALFDCASTALCTIAEGWEGVRGSRVLVSASTYVSHALHLMTIAERHGYVVRVLPATPDGAVDLDALAEALAEADLYGPSLLSLAHVPTSSGLVEPVVEAGRLAAEHRTFYLVDATQSVGQLPVDVAEIGADALVGTGRKFLRGPRGTAFAAFAPDGIDQVATRAPDVRGTEWTAARDWVVGERATRLETWEHAVAARLGLGVAADQLLAGDLDVIARHLGAAASRLRSGLAAVDRVTVTDPPAGTSAVVTFVVEGLPSTEVVARLRTVGVRVTHVPASHGQWDLGERGLATVVRASPHLYNSVDDLDTLVAAVAEQAVGEP